MKLISTYLLLFVILFSGCNFSSRKMESLSEELLNKDLEFSRYSEEYGISRAFVEYADSAAVLLKPDRMPVKGLISIRYFYSSLDDDNIELSWMPLDAVVSESGDLGYTYGIWDLILEDTTSKGTYVTIWKRNADGEWKYVLDSGNDGIGMEDTGK